MLDRQLPFCDRPRQSVLSAVGGGVLGGGAGLALGVEPVLAVALAGGIGGALDVGAHLLVRDPQFEAALETVRQ